MAVRAASNHTNGQVLPFQESLLAMLGVSFVSMLVALDQTVVGTALPTIVADLRGFELYAWVATSYLLVSVITVPIFGRLGDYYGRKPFVIASIIVFTTASALCGAADNMLFLVIARGLQGIGGGMLVGTAFACIPDLFPDAVVRLRWQVLMSSAFGIANAIGPSLGGFLTQYYGWRSVFYVNLPVGLLSLFFVWRYLPHLRHIVHETKMRLDWPGALLIALSLGSLQLFIERLPRHGVTASALVLLVVSIGGCFGVWRWEKRFPQAILPINMFRDRGLSAIFMLAALGGFAMFSLLFYAPLLLQGGFGMTPSDAGLVITPFVVFSTIGSIVNGRVVSRIANPNVMLYIGFALFAAASLGVVVVTRSMPHCLMMLFMTLGGLGLGFVLPNLTVFAQQTAGRQYLGIATALLQSLRMIGGMIGTALTGTLVTHVYSSGVREALNGDHANQWFSDLSDPQILVNRDAQQTLLIELARAGHNGAMLLETARESLVGAIHIGLALVGLVAVFSIWQCRRVPPIKLHNQIEPVVHGD